MAIQSLMKSITILYLNVWIDITFILQVLLLWTTFFLVVISALNQLLILYLIYIYTIILIELI
jgi:hypothetical protein